MLRPLRRRLRLIRYYSATREETPWTRAADIALFVTLALALPAVLLCDAIVARPTIALEQGGSIERSRAGRITARFADPESPPPWSRETFAHFTLEVIEESRGWPMATSRHVLPVRIEYNVFHEPEKRFDRGRAEDEPLRAAIGEAAARSDRAALLGAWRSGSATRTNEPILRWVFGAALWWVILYLGAMFTLALARIGALVWERQSIARMKRLARTGRCAHCGYDLRGTEFSERCPECGELA